MSKKGNCKKVRRMMVDIERHHSGHLGGMWLAWIDGVCLVSGGNFLRVNRHTVSVSAEMNVAYKHK